MALDVLRQLSAPGTPSLTLPPRRRLIKFIRRLASPFLPASRCRPPPELVVSLFLPMFPSSSSFFRLAMLTALLSAPRASTALSWSPHSPSLSSMPSASSAIELAYIAAASTPSARVVSVSALPEPSANAVYINLHADLVVSPYSRYCDAPMASFTPSYVPLNDGSLVTETYIAGLKVHKAWMLVAGALCAYFLRNTLTALSFLRRSRVKDKTLFYLLLASQFLGLMGAMAATIGDFDQSLDCTVIGAAKKIFMKVSCDIMITGILGIKAYRCLSNCRLILAFLSAVVVVMIALLVLEIMHYEGYRSVYGDCSGPHYSRWLSAMVMVVFAETAMICCCFLWAIWKSHRTQAEARLSVNVSEEAFCRPDTNDEKRSGDGINSRRGWWDYVPEAHMPSGNGKSTFGGIAQIIYSALRRLCGSDDYPPSIAYQRKSSLPGEFPIPHPARSSFRRGWYLGFGRSRRYDIPDSMLEPPPTTAWTIRRWIRGFSGVAMFRQMLRNELLYTTFFTAIFLAVAVIMLVGVSRRMLLGPEGWIVLDWFIVSAFTMHSFRRVVRRHEVEAILQHPAAWERMLRTETDCAEIFEKRARRSRPSREKPISHLHSRHREGIDPLDDLPASIMTSSELSYELPVSPYTIVPQMTLQPTRKTSAWSSLPSFDNPSPLNFSPRPFMWDSAVVLPSSPVKSDSSSESRMQATQSSTTPAGSQTPHDEIRLSLDLRTRTRTSNDSEKTAHHSVG
ncbi:uncharacterized protein LAESUDRAFT_139295 [Laetiporus sulphureus 93-53]|uniref:Uncharacterized protein n=1 Tax=Laetiporus sulphureus 93-53 TaxID=1314785 RepID=A0A165EE34_9APHY|nr:uncharacterized protein LAESUDRAFT_139295 [Laetiporus sulphureus 93-53]KZT06840.1 hypothetical protein LAESUDRAFT_139295 [Laetiporus sulphureus 93-53]